MLFSNRKRLYEQYDKFDAFKIEIKVFSLGQMPLKLFGIHVEHCLRPGEHLVINTLKICKLWCNLK